MSEDPREDQQGEAPSIPDDAIVNIGTDPVAEADFPQIGTDVVIGSEIPREDTVYMIGVEPVGKAAQPEDNGSDHPESEA